MTTDADLALDVDLLCDGPEIAETMESAGFVREGQPGHWENTQGVAVDLMVAPHQSGRPSPTARAADLKPHATKVARIGPGLAAGLVDKDALDVLRLLQACATSQLADGIALHDAGTPAHADATRALAVLQERATQPSHELPRLATRAAGDDPTVAPSFAVLVGELLKAVA